MARKRKGKEPVTPPRHAAQFRFKIGAYTPRTMPLERLAEYLTQLARVLGETHSVHFAEVAPGSTMPLVWAEPEAAPKVRERAEGVLHGTAPREALDGYETINRLLREDNASGVLRESRRGGVVLKFPGREEAAEPYFSKQAGTLTGSVLRVGGIGDQIPIQLATEGGPISGIHATRELAKELAKHLFETVRLSGQGTWMRDADGVWRLRHFRVDGYKLLDESPLSTALGAIREHVGEFGEDAYEELQILRHGRMSDGGT